MNPEPKTLTTSRLIIRKISQDLEFFDLGKNTVFKITTTTTEKGKKGSISHSYGIADSDEFSIAVDDVDTSKDKPFTQALNSCNKISSWYFVDEPEKISQIHTPTHKDLLGRACTYMYDFIHIHEIPNNADLYEDAKRGGKKLFKFDLFDHQVYDIHGELVRQPQFEDFCFRDGRYSDLEGLEKFMLESDGEFIPLKLNNDHTVSGDSCITDIPSYNANFGGERQFGVCWVPQTDEDYAEFRDSNHSHHLGIFLEKKYPEFSKFAKKGRDY